MCEECSGSRVDGDKPTAKSRNPTWVMPVLEVTGRGRPRLRVESERFIGPLLREVSDLGAVNRHAHLSRPHRRGAFAKYMHCPLRARLMPRSKLLRCRRTARSNLGSIDFGVVGPRHLRYLRCRDTLGLRFAIRRRPGVSPNTLILSKS